MYLQLSILAYKLCEIAKIKLKYSRHFPNVHLQFTIVMCDITRYIDLLVIAINPSKR